VQVFHTENKGLSAARNLGLDHAAGQYIGFVDSDDWIEPDMYKVLVDKALETGADVVECGWYSECQNRPKIHEEIKSFYNQANAVDALLCGKLNNAVWNKIWKRECFCSIRFPEGQIYEDYATTYIIYSKSLVCSISETKYHYL